mmetsp:Transcript_4384/g.5707  ORF Transcript_4384/g.5707 Transcript_4384/m.5707 type:complete len:339 (-) Transcript_4384:24-1040(-)
MFPLGPCSLGDKCLCKTMELRPRYKCVYCNIQLHSSISKCSIPHGEDGKVKCQLQNASDLCRELQTKSEQNQMEFSTDSCTAETNNPDNEHTTKLSSSTSKKLVPVKKHVPSKSKLSSNASLSSKRGLKKGSSVNVNLTLNHWYEVCDIFRNKLKVKMSMAQFLKSNHTSNLFDGSKSQQVSFGKYLKKFDNNELKPVAMKRQRDRKYIQVEEKLKVYLNLRSQRYNRDKCGVSWILIREKCLGWAAELGLHDFKVSAGWIQNTLKSLDDDVKMEHIVTNDEMSAALDCLKLFIEQNELPDECSTDINRVERSIYRHKLTNMTSRKQEDQHTINQVIL